MQTVIETKQMITHYAKFTWMLNCFVLPLSTISTKWKQTLSTKFISVCTSAQRILKLGWKCQTKLCIQYRYIKWTTCSMTKTSTYDDKKKNKGKKYLNWNFIRRHLIIIIYLFIYLLLLLLLLLLLICLILFNKRTVWLYYQIIHLICRALSNH